MRLDLPPIADAERTALVVALLKQAVAKGYKNVAQMKGDADLDALRQRHDFTTLLNELEGNKE